MALCIVIERVQYAKEKLHRLVTLPYTTDPAKLSTYRGQNGPCIIRDSMRRHLEHSDVKQYFLQDAASISCSERILNHLARE